MPPPKRNILVELRKRHTTAYDAVSMAVYTLLVYGWFLAAGPVGGDFPLTGISAPSPLAGRLLLLEQAAFGDWAAGYRLVNLAVLYACMVTLHVLIRTAVPGPFWIGALGGVLFMAHPATGNAVFLLGGVRWLLPCLLGLLALALYARHTAAPRWWKAALCGVLLVLAFYESRTLLVLPVVCILCEQFAVPPASRRPFRMIPLTLLAGVMALLALPRLTNWDVSFADKFVPLYFLFYPLGFLPQTVRTFMTYPWLGWLAALAVAGIVFLVVRKARRRELLFALGAVLLLRIPVPEAPVDWVHLTGGEQLLLPSALFLLGFVSVCCAVMSHPKWPLTVVTGTTLLCVVFFAMQIHHGTQWRRAGNLMSAWEASVREVRDHGVLVLLCPDIRHLGRVPLDPASLFRTGPPWGPDPTVVAVCPLDLPAAATIFVEDKGESGIAVTIGNADPRDALLPLFGTTETSATAEGHIERITLADVNVTGFTLRVEPLQSHFPPLAIPPAFREFP
jgi:hypothetical protein